MAFVSFWGSASVPNENLNNWLIRITRALKAATGKYLGSNSEQLTCILMSSFVLYSINPMSLQVITCPLDKAGAVFYHYFKYGRLIFPFHKFIGFLGDISG